MAERKNLPIKNNIREKVAEVGLLLSLVSSAALASACDVYHNSRQVRNNRGHTTIIDNRRYIVNNNNTEIKNKIVRKERKRTGRR